MTLTDEVFGLWRGGGGFDEGEGVKWPGLLIIDRLPLRGVSALVSFSVFNHDR